VIALARRQAAPIALFLIFLYLVLAVASTTCLAEQTGPLQQDQQQHHRHHQHNVPAHSTLCAWACQVNPTTSLASAAPLLTPFLISAFLALELSSILLSRCGQPIRSRAPPR
jgi:hypothetical protein